MNHDGIPEFMVKGKIFDSRDGSLLLAVPNPQFEYCVPIAAELGKPTQSIIIGNSIYTPNSTLTSITLEASLIFPINSADPDIPPTLAKPRPSFAGGNGIHDGGLVSVVDLDNDGKVELIYQHFRNGLGGGIAGEGLISVVDPETGTILASKYIPYAPQMFQPFVGDIGGYGKPEIVFISSRANVTPPNATEQPYWLMHAYKYVSGNPILQKFWESQHQDPSGHTQITIFDFNQDGIMEIVYRDEQNIRIINGSLKSHLTGADTTVYDLARMVNTSMTAGEYPVVADIDGDGQAEIVIVGGRSGRATSGNLCIYKSADPAHPWAPARKVWNQFAYNAAQVNEDLSIPAYPLSPATVFPNGTKPYSNFLQQQTTINSYGDPFLPLSNLQWGGQYGYLYG